MKGFEDFLQAVEGFDHSEQEKLEYCLYYDSEGKIYEASTVEREDLSYIKVSSDWPDKNHITDWTIVDGELEPLDKVYNRITKYKQITHAHELDPDMPVYVTDKDHRIIKKIISADEVQFNKDENYYQLQQEKI